MSALEICQKACLIVGANPPEAFDDGTLEGDVCKSMYDDLLDTIISQRPWTFASRSKVLSEVSEVSEYGYKYVYVLPSDCITVFHTLDRSDYDISAGKLHSNNSHVSIKYAYKPNDRHFSSGFIMALKYGIAAEINLPLTENVSRTDYLTGKFELLLNKASFTDGRSTPNKRVARYALLSAKLGSR